MKKRLRLLWIPVVFLAAWLVWPDQKSKNASGANAPDQMQTKSQSRKAQSVPGDPKPLGPSPHGSRPKPPSLEEEISFDSPEVDMLLTDMTMPEEEVARRLRLLMEDSSLPMSSRGEALEHGLNLSPHAFKGLAAQNPQLTMELSGIFLSEVMNWNDLPVEQLNTYLAWMNHPEQEIADQSLEQLRFMVGDDNHEENVQRIIEMAIQKINELKAEEQAPKQPAEPSNGESQAE